MKKVLIVSYFFPPCNLTASQRASSWAKYLPQFGYYPYVITRNWDHKINTPSDVSRPVGNGPKVVQDANSYVVYLPHEGTLKDKLYARYGDSKFTVIRKALSFIELVLQNFFLKALPFYNFYNHAVELVEKEGIDRLVITANPFVSFFIGYRLKQKFPNLKWIADYRDDWSTTELVTHRSFLQSIIYKLEWASEKKWLQSASLVTTISDYYLHKISTFTGMPGRVLYNGFSEENARKILRTERPGEFVITYTGTLYPSQPIEVFLEGMKEVINRYRNRLVIRLNFPGLAFDKTQSRRVKQFMQGYEDLVLITERIPQEKVFELQNGSHAFLMVAHGGLKGIPSSKLYEYLSYRKPVILCPDDGNIIRQTLEETNLGIICSTAGEVAGKISLIIEDYLKGGVITQQANEGGIEKYSRRNQAKELAKMLDSI